MRYYYSLRFAGGMALMVAGWAERVQAETGCMEGAVAKVVMAAGTVDLKVYSRSARAPTRTRRSRCRASP
jgi:hypothetical protein